MRKYHLCIDKEIEYEVGGGVGGGGEEWRVLWRKLRVDRVLCSSSPLQTLANFELLVFILTSWASCCCYWRLPLVAPLSGSHLSSYNKNTSWILVGHFWNAFQSDNKNHSARKPFLTKLVNDITLRKWRLNRDQTNNTLNVYWLLTRRPTRSCFWRLQLVASLSGFHSSFYDKIHIWLKMIFNVFSAGSSIFFQVH